MKKLFPFILLILTACDSGGGKAPTPPPVVVDLGEYIAEYGVPDQSLVQACTGEKDLLRPVTRCIRRATRTEVAVSFCYNMEPPTLNVPSPNGQRQVLIPGGTRLDSCIEGNMEPYATSVVCNLGFYELDGACQNFQSSGSFAVLKDQFYQERSGLRLLFSIGNDPVKRSGNYKLILLYE